MRKLFHQAINTRTIGTYVHYQERDARILVEQLLESPKSLLTNVTRRALMPPDGATRFKLWSCLGLSLVFCWKLGVAILRSVTMISLSDLRRMYVLTPPLIPITAFKSAIGCWRAVCSLRTQRFASGLLPSM